MGRFKEISTVIHKLSEGRKSAIPTDKDELLIFHYLKKLHPLHIRRTFDQYRYYSLKDTSDRDEDQVIGRVFKRQSPGKSPSEQPMLMVDQLWLWVLPNGEFQDLP